MKDTDYVEKQPLMSGVSGGEDVDELPAPSTARPSSTRWQRLELLLLVTLTLIGLPYIVHLGRGVSTTLFAQEPQANAYFDAVRAKGFQVFDKGCEKHGFGGHMDKFPGHLGEANKHPKHPHWPKLPHWVSPQRAEKIYLSVPDNSSAAAASRRYTSHAHPAGSGWDYVTALQVKNDWETQLGLKVTGPGENVFEAGSAESQSRVRDNACHKHPYVWIDTYYPVMNTPVSSSVTLLTDPPVHAKLREKVLKGDPDSELADEVRVFHGLSVSGDVKGKYVYAGYGRKQDFDLLVYKGVDFKGKIAIVKYGGNFRGLKVKAAQEAGAIGCIIFTDPGDDGEITEANGYKQYPDGPARVPSSVQRGSVQFLSKYPGDPTTPGKPAYKNATRDEGGNFPSIPSLPMSYEDVIPILKQLKGKGMSAKLLGDEFGGGLGHYGVEYWTGPSDVDLHLVNQVNTRVMPVWNTMAVIPGTIKDEVVIMGNHRDAWVLGGADPNSGTASQYEMVRGLGTLLRAGWRPMRTIVLASWDAEEYGLIGSTEWAEDFGDWLQANAVAYLNFDSSASGSNFRGAASPSLALLLRGAAEQITKIDGRSVWDAREDGGDWAAFGSALHTTDADADLLPPGSGIRPLGSGSDYTAFLQRYGVAATDFSFGGGPKDPVYHYHSVYDSHTWMAKYGDPEFIKHTEGAKIIGLVTLRLADALILPLNTTQYTRDLVYYLDNVAGLSGANKVDLHPLGRAIDQLQAQSAKLDATRAHLLKQLRKLLPRPGTSYWARLKAKLGLGCRYHDTSFPHLPSPGDARKIAKILKHIRRINLNLRDFEKGFISKDGIPDREWYKHKGTAPGKWLGYGATTFPALTEALTIEHDPTLAQKEADELTGMIMGMAKRLLEGVPEVEK